MGNNNTTSIYNSTQETIKICLLDTTNNEINAILEAGEIWSRSTDSGRNTIVIIPLNDNQETFSYTLLSDKGIIIKRHKTLGKLILVPSACDNRELEADITITGHPCLSIGNSKRKYGSHFGVSCYTNECIVFNESNESIRVCITDVNNRNTHIILAHGEHARVQAPLSPEALVKVSVVDFNLNNAKTNFIARTKDSINHNLHKLSNDPYKFIRVFKKDGYFTTEHDRIYPQTTGNIPFSYQFTKECCQKVQSFKGCCEIKEISPNKYDVFPKANEDDY